MQTIISDDEESDAEEGPTTQMPNKNTYMHSTYIQQLNVLRPNFSRGPDGVVAEAAGRPREQRRFGEIAPDTPPDFAVGVAPIEVDLVSSPSSEASEPPVVPCGDAALGPGEVVPTEGDPLSSPSSEAAEPPVVPCGDAAPRPGGSVGADAGEADAPDEKFI